MTADGYTTRETSLAWPRVAPDALIDLIPIGAPFSQKFYQQLVRNGLESSELFPIYRWTTRPRVAFHPFDDGGRAVPVEVVQTIRDVVPRAIALWSGGLFENVSLEETEIADWQEGWIVIRALRTESSEDCGRAGFRYRGDGQIVTARIELTLDRCACGSRKISPNTTSHELAHALGFWHVEGPYVLAPQGGSGCSSFENEIITSNEATHARIAYRRPPGNRDPDRDPDSFAMISAGSDRQSPTVVCR